MAAVEYNTVPEESPLLVVEAPKKKTGRVVAAVAASLILATAVAVASSTTPAPFAWSIAPKMSRLSTS